MKSTYTYEIPRRWVLVLPPFLQMKKWRLGSIQKCHTLVNSRADTHRALFTAPNAVCPAQW